MRKAIETLKNIWKIEDLRQRILITILFVAIYRFGSYVVLPVSYTHLRKMRLVADMIRGMEVNRALGVLKFSSKEAAARVEKLLRSAIARCV